MKMGESNVCMEQHLEESVSDIPKLRERIKRLNFHLARLENSETLSSNSSIKITFKNNYLANKYKTSIEQFLNTLLTEEEKKTLTFRILEENVEEAWNRPVENLFCIDTSSSNENGASASSDVPYYDTVSSEVLLPFSKDVVETEESTPSPQLTTCFNCLGNHHLRECPEKHDKTRIMRNRKNFAIVLQSNARYHNDQLQKKSGKQPGQMSTALREALGLKPHQLPMYIYHMRILGYPPGWLKEAMVESSGLNVYDSDGNVVANNTEKNADSAATQYDSDKFIEYPGFNCPVPEGFIDESQMLGMPPIQQHQQLSEAVKIFGKPSPAEPVKRRMKIANIPSSETKKVKNGGNESSQNEDSGSLETPISSPAVTDDSVDVFGTSENSCDQNSISSSNEVLQIQTPQSGGSLSSTPGTAVVNRENPFKLLPDLSKFSQGITEHLPYENLPGAVGTFEKMRNVLNCVRQKLAFSDE